MSPIQQMLLGVGAVATKTYVDDLFSTYLYSGNNSAKSINNGIDLAGEGGLVWIKKRAGGLAVDHFLTSSVSGGSATYLESNNSDASATSTALSAFNSNGFSVDGSWRNNDASCDYSSWTFRKAKGFFDVVTYTGNGTAGRTISHSLGSVPGMILVKNLEQAENWMVYHKSNGAEKYLRLNTTADLQDLQTVWNDTEPTASVFSVGTDTTVNANGKDYVAYIFAGGESTAATARSVYFGTGQNYIYTNTDNDFNFGTGDYCIECWMKLDDISGKHTPWTLGSTDTAGGMSLTAAYATIRVNDGRTGGIILTRDLAKTGQWTHVAVTRESGTSKLFINGNLEDTSTDQNGDTIGSGTNNNKITIGTQIEYGSPSDHMDGYVSNFRVVKGSAVYTSSFRPPTEPLTNITNTVLLCCNNASVTGSSVSPSTINDSGGTASTDSPFDDPAGFKFGDAENQGVIKCGSYVGNGSTDGPEINLGWEPQWVMVKRTNNVGIWGMWDSMRGMVTGGDDPLLVPNENWTESDSDRITLTPTGFKLCATNGMENSSGDDYIYLAIRRPDGYVGKPIELGTGALAIDYGSGSTTIPTFDSTFPVDFTMLTKSDDTGNRFATARLIQGKKVNLDQSNGQTTFSYGMFDSNVGSITHEGDGGSTGSTAYIGFQWKRHKGMDCLVYVGTESANHAIPHSLAQVPEMILIKRRESSQAWSMYHKGLNGGSSPEDYYLEFNSTDSEANSTTVWNSQAPTSTHFFVGNTTITNPNLEPHLALLFASVEGISKVGYYTGNASGSGQSITLGFQPRLLLIVGSNLSDQRWLFDSTTGFNTAFKLNTNAVPSTAVNGMISATSTGFDLNGTDFNGNNQKFVYYAHA
jgi:hypothetical protein